MLTRRRFIAISAAAFPTAALPFSPDLHVETAVALGAKVTLRLEHPEAPRLAALAMAEIRRLEAIFSLYLPQSSLTLLNQAGYLAAPPFELLDCLSIAGAVHRASGGRFDPTIQPLWQAEAMALERRRPLSTEERKSVADKVGWDKVVLGPDAITLLPGMSLTLNGIAQGYIADRIADLLADHGLTRALIDTGELRALSEGQWPVRLGDRKMTLQNRAVATSAPFGMTFGGDGRTSHIIDPETVRPTRPFWQSVSISAPSAGLADALSTAACLTEVKEAIDAMCDRCPGASLETAIPL